MRHSSKMIRLAVGAAFSIFVSSASAAEFTIQPRASVGSQYYEFNVEGNSDINTETYYVFGGLGVTGQVGSFFIDLYGQTNLTEGEDDNDDDGNGNTREATVNRNELNLTAGYAFTRHFSAFGGLKYAKNDIESDFSDGGEIDVETTYFGPFAGVALAFPIANVGALSLSTSLAYLDGEETIDNSSLNASFDFEGTSIGYAFGVGWSGRFGSSTSALGYGIGLDYSAYSFEDDDLDEDLFDEATLRLRFDVKYRF